MSVITASDEIVPTYGTEIKRILRLLWPLVLGQLAQMAMGVTDTIMAGIAGTYELSGVAVGGSFFWPIMLGMVGLTLAAQPIVAQLRGAQKINLIPGRMQTAFIVCLIISVLAGIIVFYSRYFIYAMPDLNERMVEVAVGYLTATALGLPGFTLFNLIRVYWEGLGHTVPTFIFGIVALCLNIPINYIFIFGKLGMPALGGVGCGVATSLTIYLTAFSMLVYIQIAPQFAASRLLRRRYPVSLSEITAFLRLGVPNALSMMLEVASFSLVAFMLSPFGAATVASHTIALNVSGMFYMLPLALSSAAAIRVGEAMGARSWNRASRTVRCIFITGLGIFALSALSIVLFRHFIIDLYTNDAQVAALASLLLLLCALYMFPDTLQVSAVGILRGFKDTRTIFIVTMIAYWAVAMPLGISLAYGFITGSKLSAPGFWIGFISGLSSAAIIYGWRLHYLFSRRQLPKGMHLKI